MKTKKPKDAKEKPARKPRAPKAKQEYFPEMGPVRNDRIHPRAERYAELRDARIAAGHAEKEAHELLLHVMLEEKAEVYKFGDLIVTVDNHRKCKVSTKADEEANGDA